MRKVLFSTLLWILIFAGIFLRLYLLFHKEITSDEVNYFLAALQYRFRELIVGDYWIKDNPPFFTMFQRFILIASPTLLALRLVNFIFGLGTIAALYKISSLILRKVNNLLLPALFSISAFFVRTGWEAKPYPMALFLQIVSFYFLLKSFREGGKRNIFLVSLFASLSLYASYTSALYIFSLFLFIVIAFWINKEHFRSGMRALALTVLFSIPIVFLLFKNFSLFGTLTPNFGIRGENFWEISTGYQFFYNQRLGTVLKGLFLLDIWALLFTLRGLIRKTALPESRLFVGLTVLSNILVVGFLKKFGYHFTSNLFNFSAISLLIIFLFWFQDAKRKSVLLALLFILLVTQNVFQSGYFGNKNNNPNQVVTNSEIRNFLVTNCKPDTLFVVNSADFNFYPLAYYYRSAYDLSPKSPFWLGSGCLEHRFVIIDNKFGIQEESVAKDIGQVDTLYFVLLSRNLEGGRLYQYLNLCKDKKCIFVDAVKGTADVPNYQ
ncbi:hypothetical protein A2V61_02235 [Candidatus Woesebacteria bacterium RBG_19FT_COMBO_47_8]|uniref:Glycosyltransferase RgtA/B/C/D-like domain-containing protein n=1 Tax=Candidatus Woesebacteria bacterium RBG_13_46_13 TaxID=1802479 RepID=A0A1F7X484_9BACT|nr:MAG: hypothetical protein A2Y68_00605 [Candidatus Woesebacteria bacterium RBG_13_46_13]OGM17429.1 MAG: hypothetical protein A2V61_02235 [Candidatus Woesebacteria bacterium RBG_19FT_COMBO_47_8]HJX59415.1 glycosyltransferase family 39 protein [Patescibacteria group bacterium]